MKIELPDPTRTLLRIIENRQNTRGDVSKIYQLALQSKAKTDWEHVNQAIVKRWNRSALKWIKNHAWETYFNVVEIQVMDCAPDVGEEVKS